MLSKANFWILAFPDLPKPIGGIKQLHRVGEILSDLGFDVHLVQDSVDFSPSWFKSEVKTYSRKQFFEDTPLNPSSM